MTCPYRRITYNSLCERLKSSPQQSVITASTCNLNFSFCSLHCSIFFRWNLFVSKRICFSFVGPDRRAFFTFFPVLFEPNEHGPFFTVLLHLWSRFCFHIIFIRILSLPVVRFSWILFYLLFSTVFFCD